LKRNIIVKVINQLGHATALLLGRWVVVATGLPTLLGWRIVLRLLLRPSLGCPRIHAALRATTVQHLHLAIDIHNHFGGVDILPFLVLPFPGLQLAFNVDLGAFAQVLPSHLSHLAEQHNPMPFGLRHQLSGLAILVTLVCGEVQVNHSVAVGGITSVRVLPQVTNENYLVYASCHRMLLIMFCGVPAVHASILCLSTLTLPD